MEVKPYQKYGAEMLGTFVLTFFGCGSAAIAGEALGTLGIALAFGLSIVAMAFAIGGTSGCHINPAVSLGVFLDKRMSLSDLIGYWVSQFIGGIIAAALLLALINMTGLSAAETGLGTNGYDEHSTVGLTMAGAILVEIILTAVFVLTILGVTADDKTSPFAGLVIGLTLTFVHIMGIPLTGTSVNPARSLGPAIMTATNGNMIPLEQVWVFIVAPLIGAALAALIYQGIKLQKK